MTRLQTLLVKAQTGSCARDFAIKRGFDVRHVLATDCDTHFALRVVPNMGEVMRWFSDPELNEKTDRTNYKPGSLLWYSTPPI